VLAKIIVDQRLAVAMLAMVTAIAEVDRGRPTSPRL
jgi:hypothetical protein